VGNYPEFVAHGFTTNSDLKSNGGLILSRIFFKSSLFISGTSQEMKISLSGKVALSQSRIAYSKARTSSFIA